MNDIIETRKDGKEGLQRRGGPACRARRGHATRSIQGRLGASDIRKLIEPGPGMAQAVLHPRKKIREDEGMLESHACYRPLPGTLPMLATLVLLSLGWAPASGTAHKGPAFAQVGIASWYGPGFHGKETAKGERFNQDKLTAAHRTLPLGIKVEVTNVTNGKSVEVEINDRGPYVNGRVIDLSRAAAIRLGMKEAGLARVQIQLMG